MSRSGKAAFRKPEIRTLPAGVVPSGAQFELTFHDLGVVGEHFENCGLTPDGHTWEQAVVEYCDERKFDTHGLEFDSESDLFSVYAASRDALEPVYFAIVELVTDEETLLRVLSELDVEEDSPEELLRLLAIEGTDLSRPMTFEFIIAFRNDSDLKSACQEYDDLGYTCYYDDSLQVAVFHEIYPNLEKLSELHSAVEKVTSQFGGKLEVFSNYDEADEPFEEIEHWVCFTRRPVPPGTHK